MPLEERRARHQALLAVVTNYDVDRWQQEFLTALRGDNGQARELENPSTLARWPSQPRTRELKEFTPVRQSRAF
jgi:trehalose-6-phosphate synthase